MFILHITYTVFKAHASTVCKRSKKTTIDTLLDTDISIKTEKSTVTYLEDTGWWSTTGLINVHSRNLSFKKGTKGILRVVQRRHLNWWWMWSRLHFVWNSLSIPSEFLFAVELLVKQENEEVNIYSSPIEQLHHCHTLVLQLQQVLLLNTTKKKKKIHIKHSFWWHDVQKLKISREELSPGILTLMSPNGLPWA